MVFQPEVMQQFDIPIIHKTYELYRLLHDLEHTVSKMERHTLWQRCETSALDVLESLLLAGYLTQERRIEKLSHVSARLDMLRVFLRLSFDVKAINQKKYISLQEAVDEIGRMLGGWLKSLRQK